MVDLGLYDMVFYHSETWVVCCEPHHALDELFVRSVFVSWVQGVRVDVVCVQPGFELQQLGVGKHSCVRHDRLVCCGGQLVDTYDVKKISNFRSSHCRRQGFNRGFDRIFAQDAFVLHGEIFKVKVDRRKTLEQDGHDELAFVDF